MKDEEKSKVYNRQNVKEDSKSVCVLGGWGEGVKTFRVFFLKNICHMKPNYYFHCNISFLVRQPGTDV